MSFSKTGHFIALLLTFHSTEILYIFVWRFNMVIALYITVQMKCSLHFIVYYIIEKTFLMSISTLHHNVYIYFIINSPPEWHCHYCKHCFSLMIVFFSSSLFRRNVAYISILLPPLAIYFKISYCDTKQFKHFGGRAGNWPWRIAAEGIPRAK